MKEGGKSVAKSGKKEDNGKRRKIMRKRIRTKKKRWRGEKEEKRLIGGSKDKGFIKSWRKLNGKGTRKRKKTVAKRRKRGRG